MATATVKAYKGIGMEGPVARWYATLARKCSKDYEALAQRAAGRLHPGDNVLEVAPGPGYLSIELAKLGAFHVTGLDISETFVQIARANVAEAKVDVCFLQGNASGMPFESSTFDFLFCRAAFKNFSEPVRALQEMCRVLKPGGNALVIDLRKDAPREAISQLVDGMGLNRINAFATKLTFRFMLLRRAYTQEDFRQFLSHTNFSEIEIQESSTGLEVSLRK